MEAGPVAHPVYHRCPLRLKPKGVLPRSPASGVAWTEFPVQRIPTRGCLSHSRFLTGDRGGRATFAAAGRRKAVPLPGKGPGDEIEPPASASDRSVIPVDVPDPAPVAGDLHKAGPVADVVTIIHPCGRRDHQTRHPGVIPVAFEQQVVQARPDPVTAPIPQLQRLVAGTAARGTLKRVPEVHIHRRAQGTPVPALDGAAKLREEAIPLSDIVEPAGPAIHRGFHPMSSGS